MSSGAYARHHSRSVGADRAEERKQAAAQRRLEQQERAQRERALNEQGSFNLFERPEKVRKGTDFDIVVQLWTVRSSTRLGQGSAALT